MFNFKIPVELDPFGLNRNSAVNRRNVYMDRETTGLGVQKRMTVRLET